MCVCIVTFEQKFGLLSRQMISVFPSGRSLQKIFLNDYCSLLLVFKSENILLMKLLKRDYDKGNIYFNHLWLIFFMLSGFHGSLINGRNNWEVWVKEGPMSSNKNNPKCVRF